jgi:2'-5' RNA ligase
VSSGARRDGAAPLVVTLALAEGDQERFDALRRAHFSAGRNHLSAHVTLFHAVPGEREEEVVAALRAAAPPQPFAVRVSGVRLLGRGVAYGPEPDLLSAVHRRLLNSFEAAFGEALSRQDRQRLSAHVSVQNKVEPPVARGLHAQLAAGFTSSAVTGTGLALWRYLGGPWEHLRTVRFPPC